MCCFSLPIKMVASTRIFARRSAPGRQILAYSMTVEAAGALAMILPLPVRPGAAEDEVRFFDLSGYPGLLEDMEKAFPEMMGLPKGRGLFRSMPMPQPRLAVHQVGDFEASFVPRLADFERLDPRFRLDPGVWASLPQYADYGFAVFQLRGFGGGWLGRLLRRASRRSFHPMAFEFPTRAPGHLFWPSVHIHDGKVHPEAEFDHSFFAQLDDGEPLPWALGAGPGAEPGQWSGWQPGGEAALHVDVVKSRDVVAPRGGLFKVGLHGSYLNADLWAPLPA